MIRIGICGVGNAGANHTRTLNRTAGAEVVAIADIDKSKARRVAQEHGIASWSDDWRSVIDDDAVDTVVVATPPFAREAIFVAAAKAGKRILCEKPFGTQLKQARRMAQAAEQAGVEAMVNFGTRNLPVFQAARAMLASGAYGRPQAAWCKYNLVASPYRFMPPAWFYKKKNSGGHLVENAGHAIDFICEVMGGVKTVSGVTAQLDIKPFGPEGAEPDIENLGVATLRHTGGGVSVITNGSNPAGQWGMWIDILTETAMVSIAQDRVLTVMQEGRQVYRKRFAVGWDPIPAGGRAFVRYLRGKLRPDDSIATPEDGVRAIRIAEATYRSSRQGQAVKLNEV